MLHQRAVRFGVLIVRVVLHFRTRVQSVGYTEFPLFLLALVWFVGFGVVMLVISFHFGFVFLLVFDLCILSGCW